MTRDRQAALRLVVKMVMGLLLVGALVACGSTTARPGSGGGGGQQLGTVAGQVLAYPCAPVERVGSPCPGRPAPGVEVDLRPVGGGATAKALTGADGRYSIQVAPGTYSVTIAARRALQPTPATVQVTAGGTATANFVVDSGIR